MKKFIFGLVLTILLSANWGFMCGIIFLKPFDLLFAIIGGGFIGYLIGELVTISEES